MSAPSPASASDQPSRRLWLGALLVVCALILLPLLLVDVPPLLDYPNHLARLFVLAHPDDPILSRIYVQRWSVIPNLAIDVVAPPLLRLLPVHVAGRVVLAVALVLPVIGCAAFSRAAFGRRSLWPIASALMAYNALFILGFVNFQIALGLALLAGALWYAWVERSPVRATLATAVAATVVFFCHLFGMLLLGLLIGGREVALLWRAWRAGRPVAGPALRRGSLLAGVFVVPVSLYFMAPLHDAGGAAWYFSWPRKLIWLFCSLADYHLLIWLASAVVVGAVLLFLVLTGRMRGAAGSALVAGVLLVAYVAAPLDASETSFIDARLPVMLGLLLFAGFMPVGVPRVAGGVIAILLAGLFVARLAAVSGVWLDHNRDVAALRDAIAPVQPGDRVLAATLEFRTHTGYWGAAPVGRMLPAFVPIDVHMAALVTIERRAFWPFLFAVATKQPLAVRPPYDRFALPSGHVPDIGVLDDPAAARDAGDTAYLAHWQDDFDYVLLLNPGGVGDLSRLLPERMALVRSNDMAALFRVRPTRR
jgi:hypothetical protein